MASGKRSVTCQSQRPSIDPSLRTHMTAVRPHREQTLSSAGRGSTNPSNRFSCRRGFGNGRYCRHSPQLMRRFMGKPIPTLRRVLYRYGVRSAA